jgi:hypothetical protein
MSSVTDIHDVTEMKAEVKVKSGHVVLQSPESLPPAAREVLEKSLTVLNKHIGDGDIRLEDVDLSPLVMGADEGVSTRATHPCNWVGVTTHWWGLTVYMSKDLVNWVCSGHVAAADVARKYGGAYGMLIAVAILAQTVVIMAYCGKCGECFDLTWAGIPKKFKKRD